MKIFLELFKEELAKDIELHPEEYASWVSVPGVSATLEDSLLNGSYAKDSRVIKNVCERLGIANTYESIDLYLSH